MMRSLRYSPGRRQSRSPLVSSIRSLLPAGWYIKSLWGREGGGVGERREGGRGRGGGREGGVGERGGMGRRGRGRIRGEEGEGRDGGEGERGEGWGEGEGGEGDTGSVFLKTNSPPWLCFLDSSRVDLLIG